MWCEVVEVSVWEKLGGQIEQALEVLAEGTGGGSDEEILFALQCQQSACYSIVAWRRQN